MLVEDQAREEEMRSEQEEDVEDEGGDSPGSDFRRWEARAVKGYEVLKAGFLIEETLEVRLTGRSMFHTLADRGCEWCDQKLGRKGPQGCLFAAGIQCGHCGLRGHAWEHCPGRGVFACPSCMMTDHEEEECPRPVNGVQRELVRRIQNETSEQVEAVEEVR